MIDKSLVFYDQVQNGIIVRFELSGDKEAALKHVRTGRQVLGQMRSATALPDLENEGLEATGGSGFWHQHQTPLEDGTTIHVMHNEGLETVRIHTPFKQAQEKVKKPKIVEPYISTFQAACGGMGDDGETGAMPWVWKDGPQFGYSYPTGQDYGEATDISWDGDTVCGFFQSMDTTDDDYNFVWTRGQGTHGETNNIGLCRLYGYASAISGDGNTVVTTRGWVWSLNGGWQRLPFKELSAGPTTEAFTMALGISGDGKYICGMQADDNGLGGERWHPAIWTRSGENGDYTARTLPDGDRTWHSLQDGYVVGDVPPYWEGHTLIPKQSIVTNEGVAYLPRPLEPYTEIESTDGGGNPYIFYDITHSDGGVLMDIRYDGSMACGYIQQPDESAWEPAFWRDGALTEMGLPPGTHFGMATAISQSGDEPVVAGWGSTDNSICWWWWTPSNGYFIVSNEGAAALCITQDGSVTAGAYQGGASVSGDGFAGAVGEGVATRNGRTSGDWDDFDVPEAASCQGITKLTILLDENGDYTFLPPMPGLRLRKDRLAMWPLGERPDMRNLGGSDS